MGFKNKWNDLGIKKKTFLFSSVVIVIAFSILYLSSSIFLPRLYYNHKVDLLDKSVNEFINRLESENFDDINSVVDEFSFQNNLMISIVTSDNQWVYSTFKSGSNAKPSLIPEKGLGNEKRNPRVFNENRTGKPVENLNLEVKFNFKEIDKECVIMIHTPIKNIDEGEIIAKLFFPFAFLTILVVAITISIFYSRRISNPLIKIKEAAEGMAALDFTRKLPSMGNDEIGELASSLNVMNSKLDKSFTELDDVNKKLQIEIDKERKIEKERREFIATISHELKSPITIISGQIEGMSYNIGKYKDRDKYLKESYLVIEKMRELVSELLDISKRDKDDFKLNIEKINLSKLVKEILRENYYFIELKELKLQEDISEEVWIECDKLLLKKAISNIIKNAVQHSPANENIFVELNNSNLIVKNSGVQIDEAESKEIFKAFYRIDKARNRKDGNTGLGLYIVKTILDKHKNINYNIESSDNEVTFVITF
ncbi:MAG: sensor histidine kinase [Clostridium sp.]